MTCTGVYWYGPVFQSDGYGNVCRNYIRALETAGIPVFIHQSASAISKVEAKFMSRNVSLSDLGSRIALVRHGLPPLAFVSDLKIPNVNRTIGVTIFETDRLPSRWAELCNLMDEVWVPSAFNYSTFSANGVSTSKLKVVPYALDVTKYYPGRPYTEIRFSPKKTFSFLYVSQFDWRKGYDLLINAFCQEFSLNEPVSLVLKVNYANQYKREDVYNEIARLIPSDRLQSQIYFVLEQFDETELIDLYQSCDAYISMDRAGWGLPAMEMMALGKPVIALDWGGYTEFMNESNSFLIPVESKLVPVDSRLQAARPEFYLGHHWADVREHHVRRTMREVYGNREKRERIARRAALDIHFNYSHAVVGEFMKKLLC